MRLTWEPGQELFLLFFITRQAAGTVVASVRISTRDLSGWLVKAAGSMAFVKKYILGAAISRSLPDVGVQKLLQRMACGRAQWRTEGLMW